MKKHRDLLNIRNILLVLVVLAGFFTIYFFFSNLERSEIKNVDATNIEFEPKYNIISDEANYFGDSLGFYVHPEEKGNYPGIIMIHEWWGLNDNIRAMAKQLSAQGYNVLAVDLYDGNVAEDANAARNYSSIVRENPQKAIDNMKAAKAFLESQNSGKIASLGWCFGGQQSLQISLNDYVDATVIYYGQLVINESELSRLKNPVLGIFGGEDTSIPTDTVKQFESSLNNLEIENEIYIYDGVGHAFANPSGANYAPNETNDAWVKTLKFLEENLKN